MNIIERVQVNADNMRLLKAGLRSHDPDAVDGAFIRIKRDYGNEIATEATMHTITKMISDENWSWFDNEGNPSPLLYHNLPE